MQPNVQARAFHRKMAETAMAQPEAQVRLPLLLPSS
jgi:hypothetical protein